MDSKIVDECTVENSSADDDREWQIVSPADQPPPIAVAVAVPIPSAPPPTEEEEDVNVNVTTDVLSDEEVQATVEAARAEGISVIRNHYVQHISNNPNSTYVTWIATLHPENAQVVIDPRFLIVGNPWLSVYEETRYDFHKGRGLEIEGVSITPQGAGSSGHNEAGERNKKKRRSFGFLDFMIGSVLVLVTVAVSFAMEVIAAYCFLSYWACHQITKMCGRPTLFTCIPFYTAFLLGFLFKILDALFLLISIVLVEWIAGVNYVLCTFLSCNHDQGRLMHQITRKLPHLVRWAFRKKFEEWSDPPRMHFGVGSYGHV